MMDDPEYPSLAHQSDLDMREHKHWTGVWNEQLCGSLEKKFGIQQQNWFGNKVGRPRVIPEIIDLYKYRSFDSKHPERTTAILADQKLWAASLHSLNDPMEAGFRRPKDRNDAEAAYSFVYMMRSQWNGCISFSVDPVCNLMWSHYAADHSGFCIKYRRRDSFLLSSDFFRPVLYRAFLPKLRLDNPRQLPSMINAVFWTKSQAWEYEREWRLRYPRTDAYTRPGLLRPAAVIFGLRTPKSLKELIKGCAPTLQFGEIQTTTQDYRLSIRWESDVSESEEQPISGSAVVLDESCDKVLSLCLSVARMQLDEFGIFNPFGVIVSDRTAEVLMIDSQIASRMTPNQLQRRVEDLIREARAKKRLQFAAIVSDSNVRPVEGGIVTSAITGRIEQRNGPAFQFIQHYTIASGVILGERTLIPKAHHLIPK